MTGYAVVLIEDAIWEEGEATKQKIQPQGKPLKPWKDKEVPISEDEIAAAISQWDANPKLRHAKGILDAEQATAKAVKGVLGNKAGHFVTIDDRPVFIGGPGAGAGSSVGGGGYSQETIDGALLWVQQLTLSSRPGTLQELTQDQRVFLSQTVDKTNYIAYRGLGLVKDRVAPEHKEILNNLLPGDQSPDFLGKQDIPYESWTTKRSVARAYSEGQMSIVMKAIIPGNMVIVNTAKLPQLLQGITQNIFDHHDLEYFNNEAELLVDGFPACIIHSISGRLSKIYGDKAGKFVTINERPAYVKLDKDN